MNSKQLIQSIIASYYDQHPLMIWGPPGIGKTDCVVQAGRILGEQLVKEKKIKKAEEFRVVDFRLLLRDPTELKGLAMPNANRDAMVYLRDKELPTDGYGILFMDEMNSAPQAMQAAAMQLTLKNHQGENRIGDYVLPKGWAIEAAGNREGDRGVVNRMPTPLANRFTHVDLSIDPDAWVAWALDQGGKISPELIAWIRSKKDALFSFNPKVDTRAFASPRSWVATEKWRTNAHLDPLSRMELIKGTVGDGLGIEYWGFLDVINELPSVDEIRKNPDTARLPAREKPSAKHFIATMLGANATKKDFGTFLKYTERMEKEFQALFVRDCLHRDRTLETSKEFVSWVLANQNVL